ncbi:hypothetical protein [Nesterenkonia sp. CF4.4]|uniref:hypothetical protein n=1 Tax=Nesterenkonia sp. CF4.4 TaxID=3373079 RepID=UPI003EE6D4E2
MAQRIVARAGGARALWRAWSGKTLTLKSFVAHNFMDASVVAPAWALMEQGQISDEPAVWEAQERLGALSQPETGRLVPTCTQHSVLDSAENTTLLKLLPLRVKTN